MDINIFSSCIVFPGDIEGVIIPLMMHQIFQNKIGITKPHPYTLYLTQEGDLLMGLTEDKMKKPLIPLDTLVKTFEINERLGILK